MVDDKPIGMALNRNLGGPTAPGEAVDAELNRLIERRPRPKDSDEETELWKESVRAYEEKRRQVARLEWHAHNGFPFWEAVAIPLLLSTSDASTHRFRPSFHRTLRLASTSAASAAAARIAHSPAPIT